MVQMLAWPTTEVRRRPESFGAGGSVDRRCCRTLHNAIPASTSECYFLEYRSSGRRPSDLHTWCIAWDLLNRRWTPTTLREAKAMPPRSPLCLQVFALNRRVSQPTRCAEIGTV